MGPPFGGVIVDEASGLLTLIDMPFRASDPRAAGRLTATRAMSDLSGDGLRSGYSKEGLRLVNDGGAWVGTGVRLTVNEKDQRTKKQKGRDKAPLSADLRFMELTGEGGYEGLSMVVTVGADGAVGVIMPTDAVPTQPEPPLAEAAE
jgi:hypothetical protein